jgi:hypothetical protein
MYEISEKLGDSPFSNAAQNYLFCRIQCEKFLVMSRWLNFAFFQNEPTPASKKN